MQEEFGGSRYAPTPLLRRMVEAGLTGRKSGRGFYEYRAEGVPAPAGAIVVLRSYVRHRQTLVEASATCIHRMQKALTQMNLMLHHV